MTSILRYLAEVLVVNLLDVLATRISQWLADRKAKQEAKDIKDAFKIKDAGESAKRINDIFAGRGT